MTGAVAARRTSPSHRPAGREAGEYIPQSRFHFFLLPVSASQLAKPNRKLKARELVGSSTEVNFPGQVVKCRRMESFPLQGFLEKNDLIVYMSLKVDMIISRFTVKK